jgi:branched-chain amino acid transport system ATP-binding protein
MMGAFSRLVPLAEIKRDLAYVYDLFPVLADRRRQDAVSMSGGEQQMCAIGRGIMAKPDLLMIDELSLGLAPVAVEILLPALKRLALSGIGLLVVEQDVAVALDLADRAIILDRGRITREGKSGDLIADSAIIEAYLGTDTGEQS